MQHRQSRFDTSGGRPSWLNQRWSRAVDLRLILLGVAVILAAVAYPASNRLHFDRSVSSMFRPDDPTFINYQQLQQSFGGNSIVILVYQDHALATPQGLLRNQQIADELLAIPGVNGVLSPAKLNRAVNQLQPMSLLTSSPVLLNAVLFNANNAIAAGFDDIFAGYTHSADHKRAAVVAILDPDRPSETLDNLKEFASELPSRFTAETGSPIGKTVLVGEPVLVNDGFKLIQRDGNRLAILTLALLSLVVLISLADLRFILLIALSVPWSVVVTRAMMVWIGIELSLVSSVLTAIVTVIAVAATLHIGIRFRVCRSRGCTQREATVRALARLSLPIVWTCATDAAGFAALYASTILPIRQFGIMISVASLAVLISIFLLAPSLMMLPPGSWFRSQLGRQRLFPTQRSISRRLRQACLRIADSSIRHRSWCLGFTLIALIVLVPMVGKIETETSFLKNFRSGSPVVQAYEEVEANFGGAGVWDVVVETPREITADFLDEVRSLEEQLRSIRVGDQRLTKVLSIADAEQIAGKATLSQFTSPASRLSFMSLTMPSFYKALLSPPRDGKREMRIMLRSHEHLQAADKVALIAKVQQTVSQHVDREAWTLAGGTKGGGHVTGYYVLMARLVDQLVKDQWRCFAASGFFVWCLLALATQSVRLATVTLLPNLLPVLVVLALVVLLGFRMNMGAAMIAAVSIGLSIDGSVHFLNGYQRSRRRGHHAKYAATHAAGNVGVPVLLATIALATGFAVLATSEFVPTATFGVLVAATLVLGTIVNLTLLPALVSYITEK